MSKLHNQRALFDVQDTYSYTLYEKRSASQNVELSMPISNELAPVSEVGLLLAPSGGSSNVANINEVTGFGSKTEKREALYADVHFNNDFPIHNNAMGLLTENVAKVEKVDKVEKVEKVESTSILAPILNLIKPAVEVKAEKLSEVKAEELKKTVIEAVQEESKRPMHDALPEKEKVIGKAEQLAEAVATKVEAKLIAKPEILTSREETKKTVTECVKETCKKQSNMSEEAAHKVAKDVVSATLDKVDAKMTQEKVAASVIIKQPEVAAKTTAVANAIKSVIEDKSKVEVNSDAGHVIIKSNNDNALVTTINHMAENLLKPVVEEKVKSLVEVSKEEKTTGEGKHEVKLEVDSTNKLLKQVQEEISKEVTKKVVEGFMQRLPERFTSNNKRSYVRPTNVYLYAENGQKINIGGSIRQNMLEAFEQASQDLTTKTSTPEVKSVVNTVSSSDIKQNNVVSVAANVVNQDNGTKKINVDVCATCKPEDSKTFTNSVASIVASKLLDKNVSTVEVKSTPGTTKNTTNLTVSATVPMGESGNEVAESVVKSVNDASVVIGSKKQDKNNSDGFVNVLLVGLIGYVAYKYFNK